MYKRQDLETKKITLYQSWACPNHLFEFAASGYFAKAFVIYVMPGRDLRGKAEICGTKSSVLRDCLTFESWDFISGPTLIPPGEPKYVWSTRTSMIWRYYRSKSSGTTHGSFRTTTFFTDHSPLLFDNDVMDGITSGLERARGCHASILQGDITRKIETWKVHESIQLLLSYGKALINNAITWYDVSIAR